LELFIVTQEKEAREYFITIPILKRLNKLMNKNVKDNLYFLQRLIITLLNTNLFYIFIIITTILYSYYINMNIGAFILGIIITLFCLRNNYISILINILITISIIIILHYYIL